jgi:sugar lactone lactonase YvrE
MTLLLVAGPTSALASARTITTVAGSATGLHGFSGDGGPASAALLKNPAGIAVGPQGDVFVADYGNARVRKIDPGGTITTIAGSGVTGYLGDGGPATSARLAPAALAVSEKGDVYVSDCDHHVVRVVDPGGEITTAAGTGSIGFSGDNGAATAAKLNCPLGLALDSKENLYIADRGNKRVRMVTPGGTITTFAGNGNIGPASGDGGPATSATFFPQALAFGADDSLYIADAFENNVRKVDPGGTITTFAGTGQGLNSGDGGPASSAALRYPAGVTLDGDGNVFIMTQCRVREVVPAGTITTIAGTESCAISGDGCAATSAQFIGANSGVSIPVAADEQGNLFFADYSANNVREILTTEPPPSCAAAAITPPPPTPKTAPKAKTPPLVRILSGPAAETAEQRATFTFRGVAGGTYQCSIDAGPWTACRSGEVFGPLVPGDHLFQVRETLDGLTGPAASYRWTIALPRACVLRVARARVFAYTKKRKVRLVIRYTSYHPADVTVSYSLTGTKGKLALGKASAHFDVAGVFRLPETLDGAEAGKVAAAQLMTVHFAIAGAPGSCRRYYTKRLTIPQRISGQTVWFQSDSTFAR